MREKIGKVLIMAMMIFSVISSLVVGLQLATNVSYAGTCGKGLSEAKCNKICKDGSLSEEQKAAAGCNTKSGDVVTNNILSVIQIAIGAVGLIAVLVIVFAGQRFLSANGDPGRLKQAKDMISYAVIAIMIAVLAFAIVNFVAGILTTNANLDKH